MYKFHMTDIIPLLPIPAPPTGKSSYNVPCPHCDRRGRKKDKHLNINLSKDVFNCVLCEQNGGIFDLYSFLTKTPRDKVRSELIKILNSNEPMLGRKNETRASVIVPPKIIESPAADAETRNITYRSLLSMLSLAQDHKQSLLRRGLSESAIINNGYRTTPLVGGRIIAKQLLAAGCQIEGIPGFYKENNNDWTFIEMKRGIMVPVLDIQGRIQGLQVRRDNVERRKYRWVSSADISGGCAAESWIHLAGPIRQIILLSEGPMKADIIYHLTGQTVLAVPGVNSLKHLHSTLVQLIECGVKQIMTAFDMDFLKNPNVQNGYEKLVSILSEVRLPFGTYLWHPDYNGLDDYIWEFCMHQSKHI